MTVPIAYFVSAYAALLLAMITVARDPASPFVFLQPSVAGTVHLVTLGWITGTILGAVYVVGPLALRLRLDIRRVDYVARHRCRRTRAAHDPARPSTTRQSPRRPRMARHRLPPIARFACRWWRRCGSWACWRSQPAHFISRLASSPSAPR
jgi:hypothetical protein